MRRHSSVWRESSRTEVTRPRSSSTCGVPSALVQCRGTCNWRGEDTRCGKVRLFRPRRTSCRRASLRSRRLPRCSISESCISACRGAPATSCKRYESQRNWTVLIASLSTGAVAARRRVPVRKALPGGRTRLPEGDRARAEESAAYNNLARMLVASGGDGKRAVELATKAVDLRPRSSSLLDTLDRHGRRGARRRGFETRLRRLAPRETPPARTGPDGLDLAAAHRSRWIAEDLSMWLTPSPMANGHGPDAGSRVRAKYLLQLQKANDEPNRARSMH